MNPFEPIPMYPEIYANSKIGKEEMPTLFEALTNPRPKRAKILTTAINLTTGDRNKSYGDAHDNMKRFVDLIKAYMGNRTIASMNEVDGAMIMCLTKIGRVSFNHFHEDNYVDLSAYSAIAGESAERIQNADKTD